MKILVIGDIIKDHYIYGTINRLNPEGIMPLVTVSHTETRPGGAANLYANLSSLGLDADIVDYEDEYKSVKTRIIADGQCVLRFDRDSYMCGMRVVSAIKELDLTHYSHVLLSDYAKGTLDQCNVMISHILAANPDIKIIVDPKRPFGLYDGSWLIKSNNIESEKYNDGRSDNIIMTSGDKGAFMILDSNHYDSVAPVVNISDVTGAGDCFLAAFMYALNSGYNYQRCLDTATIAASKSVSHPGTYVLTEDDVNTTVVFTNGCFDILHRGHIDYLEQSKKLGTKLIVGINSDESVKRLKGPGRPVNNQEDRMKAVAALRCVDEVFIFDEDTPINLISQLKPDIITKGGDYTPETVVGNTLAKVVILPYTENYSTTEIIGKL